MTLEEVVQMFELESKMFNVKGSSSDYPSSDMYRTVILTKNVVEIDGITKLIVMVRDVTEKLKFEQELLKKKHERARTFNL